MRQSRVTRRKVLQYGLAGATIGPWVLLHTRVAAARPGALSCNVAIIGGGAGGIHTAYQLAKLPSSNPNADVCVFEKRNRLGGRIFDVALNPARPDLVFGTGALRGEHSVILTAHR